MPSRRQALAPRLDAAVQFAQAVGKVALAEAAPPVDDRDAHERIIIFTAKQQQAVVRFLRHGRDIPGLSQAQVQHIAGHVVVVPELSVDDAFARADQ